MLCMRSFAAGLSALLLFVSLTALAQTPRPPVKPGKIFVDSFGMGEDAEQLKVALGYELNRAGLKVVDYQQQADSTISGLIVTRVDGGKQVKRVTVFLKDRSGKTVWNQDIGSTATATRDSRDGIRQRAEEIARVLMRDAAAPRKKKATQK
jgi:hypothetical protein